MTIRRRIAFAVLAVLAWALVLVGSATYALTRSFLLDRLDRQLSQPLRDDALQGLTDLLVAGATPPVLPPALRADIFAETIAPDGTRRVIFEGRANAQPILSEGLLERARAADGPVLETSSDGEFRLAVDRRPNGSLLALGTPLRELRSTLGRLLRILVVVSAIALALATLAAVLIVRRGLRPLESVADTADAIVAGDLSHRVPIEPGPGETARVGGAMNAMLDRLESSFSAQRESEDRVRRFVADASHELRTPLTAIRGYAELLRRGPDLDPAAAERSIRHIEAEAGRMSRLIDDMLLLARLDEHPELAVEAVRLGDVVRDAVETARVRSPGHQVAFDVADEMVVQGDGVRLRQVFDNLLSNAARHAAGARTELVAAREGDEVVVSVRDHGPGLPPGDPAALFDRFSRGDASRTRGTGGTGIGLAIVAAIVRAHGGRVAAADAPGGGAVFTVRLPAAGPPVAAALLGSADSQLRG